MKDGNNPCDVCRKKDKASECSGCVLDCHSINECGNDECMLHYECGCLIGIDDVCGASTCYEDDIYDHSCSECEYCQEEDGEYYCTAKNEEVGKWDTACVDFVERDGE